MAWPLPDVSQLANIIYNATFGFPEHDTSRRPTHYAALIHQSRIAQGIAVLNRAHQEVQVSPGWGSERCGTEDATVSHPIPETLQECVAAAEEALQRCRPLFAGGGNFSHPRNLWGAQYYYHDYVPQGTTWPRRPRDATHLVEAYGPLQDVAACIRRHGRRPRCRGYLGIYVHFRVLAAAFASQQSNLSPHEVFRRGGPELHRALDYVRSQPWSAYMHRHGH